MKRGTRSLVWLLGAWLASPGFVQAQLHFVQSDLDLGTLRGGVPASGTFRFTNPSPDVVELIDLERGCGCLSPRWDTKTLRPGESAALTVQLRTLGQPEGPRAWNATLVYRQGSAVRRQPLTLQARLRNDVVVQPPQLAVYTQGTTEAEIVLHDRRDRPLHLQGFRTGAPGVRTAIHPAGPGRFRVVLSLDVTGLPAGRHEYPLYLATDDPVYGELEVPLTVVREEKARVSWEPAVPEVIVAPGQKQGSVLVRLKATAEVALAVSKAEPTERGMSCTWAEAAGGVMMRLRVDRSTFPPEALQAGVRLSTSAGPVTVPVLVRLE